MFNYPLPTELIAQEPCEPRDQARLLVLNRSTGTTSHHIFRDLPKFLQPGDCLVLNDTKVIPARIFGQKSKTGGKVELLLLESEGNQINRCLGQPGKRLKPGSQLIFNHGSVQAEVLPSDGEEKRVQFGGDEVEQFLSKEGEIPLPPYIRRAVSPSDREWYQTVFAREAGAVAAPTAGLHFTKALLEQIRDNGVRVVFVTLHVGWGTFKPVSEKELESGRLHEERFIIPIETAEAIQRTKADRKRVIAVGTTVVRALETWATSDPVMGGSSDASLASPEQGLFTGTTDIFIQPPFQFKTVDALVTNFHLPGTSLLYLVSAFAGEKSVRAAYQEAVQERYRFYSYGDAMLIV